MEVLGNPSWLWGLSLIVLTITIHAAAVLIMAFVGTRIRVQLETRSLHQWMLIPILICAKRTLTRFSDVEAQPVYRNRPMGQFVLRTVALGGSQRDATRCIGKRVCRRDKGRGSY